MLSIPPEYNPQPTIKYNTSNKIQPPKYTKFKHQPQHWVKNILLIFGLLLHILQYVI